MNIMDRIRGFREFASKEQIMRHIERGMRPEDYGLTTRSAQEKPAMHFHDFNHEEHPRDADGLLISRFVFFHTRYQKTMLVKCSSTHASGGVKCLLDDTRKNHLLEKWEIPKSEIPTHFNPDTIRIYNSTHPDYGYLDFGPHHRGWYYSKKLFNGKEDLMRQLMEFATFALK